MKNINKYSMLLAAVLLLLAPGCTQEKGSDKTGEAPLELGGVISRSDGVNGDRIYLMAVYDAAQEPYFGETLISFPDGLTSSPKDAVFPGVPPHYPIITTTGIRLFAYSGKAPNGYMTLVAGHGPTFDAVLSNTGYAEDGTYYDQANGTLGSTRNPASILQFRHVMTRLVVEVQYDQSVPVDERVDPLPTSMSFEVEGVMATGRFNIRTPEPPDDFTPGYGVTMLSYPDLGVSPPSGSYHIQLGENYLVPNYSSIQDKHFKSLVIDNYKATEDDLKKFTITYDENDGRSGLFVPGYAYKLTLTVKRLQVTGARLSKIDWARVEETNTDVTYDPQPLQLDFSAGEYQNSGEDQITKVVLHNTTAGKAYIGQSVTGATGVQFVLLPTAVDSVDLYTRDGLLISQRINSGYDYTGKRLSMGLSRGGMLLLDQGGAPNSETNPYLITTVPQFMNVQRDMTAHYRQSTHVDLNTLNLISTARLFNGFETEFTGSYDGNGMWVAGLDINGPGLFAINGAAGVLKNIRIFNGQIEVTGPQTTLGNGQTGFYAGGICGVNNGMIQACINEAMLFDPAASGQISVIGGICGQNTGQVVACLNTGGVPSAGIVGGIVGSNDNTAAHAVSVCVNTGNLYPEASYLGGVAGLCVANAAPMLSYSYWLVGTAQRYIGVTGVATEAPGVTPLNCAALDPNEMRNQSYPGDTQPPVLDRLNGQLQTQFPAVLADYEFILAPASTGVTWPMPVKKN